MGELIADIFGSSDEEEEFEGFQEEDVAAAKAKERKSKAVVSDDEDGDDGPAPDSGAVLPDLSSDEEMDKDGKDRAYVYHSSF